MKARTTIATRARPKTMAGRLRAFCATRLLPLLLLLMAALPSLQAQTNGTVRFERSVGEGGESWVPPISNTIYVDWVDVRSPASVTLQVTGGTAREGVDFTLSQRVLSNSSGQNSSSFVISGITDGLSEGQETIELTLTNPTGGVVMGWPNRVTIAWADSQDVKSFNLDLDDATRSPMLVWKHAGTVWLNVWRQRPIAESAEVVYRTEPGTAQPGVDYTAVSGTLHFGTNENWGKNIEVPILTNSLPVGDRDFRVVLSNPSPGYLLGSPKELTVRIQNDDAGFALQPRFGTNGNYELPENAGEALVDVVILGDTATRPVSVEYRTQPISATLVEDYTPVSGTLTFATGETRKTIAIPITNDNRSESENWPSYSPYYGVHSFKLFLENPTGGLLLSRPREVEIHIRDNDPGYSITGNDGNSGLNFDEQSGTVTITVNRQGDFNVPSSVHYRVTANSVIWGSGSATVGSDFLPTEGTLTFGASETNKTFTVTLLDDSLIEGAETFFIVLDQATGGVPIYTPEVRVVIRDDERNPVRVDPDFKPDWPIPPDRPQPLWIAQLDGKILLATPTDRLTGEDGTFVLRLMPDGRADPAWNVPDIRGELASLVPQTNGQVLVGLSGTDFTVNGVSRRHLARLNTDGSLDTGFSAAFPTNMFVTVVAVQSDGQVLVAAGNNSTPFTLIRLNASGSLDPAFMTPVINDMGTILPAPDGNILVSGWTGQGYGLLRFKSDGSPDGQFQPPPDSILQAMLPDGRLMVVHETNSVWSLVRLEADGQLDPTFTPITSYPSQVLPAAAGKIWVFTQSSIDFCVLRRIKPDGSDDPSWPVASA